MVLLLLALPLDLQAVVVQKVADTATAGRLVQASRAGYRLGLRRAVVLREERRAAEQALIKEARQRKRNGILVCFDGLSRRTGGAFYQCKVPTFAGGTPCGC